MDPADGWSDLLAAAERPAEIVGEDGSGVVLCVGRDVPVELVLAAGLRPWVAPVFDEAALERLLESSAVPVAGVILSHQSDWQVRAFARLRELMRLGALTPRPLCFCDLPQLATAATATYSGRRLRQLAAWLAALPGGRDPEPGLTAAIDRVDTQRRALAALAARCRDGAATVSGTVVAIAARAAWALPLDDHVAAVTRLVAASGAAPVPAASARRVLLTGGAVDPLPLVRTLEAGAETRVVAVDGDHGDLWHELPTGSAGDPYEALIAAHHARARSGARAGALERAEHVVARAGEVAADAIVHVRERTDAAAAWDRAALKRRLEAAPAMPLEYVDLAGAAAPADGAAPVAAAAPSAPHGRRSRKSLDVVGRFGAYQREWFAQVRARALAGEPFAVVNADTPQELLRALDIPFVVNQWWSSIVSAKQQAPAHLAALAAHGLPDDADPYSALALAGALAPEGEPPWGGLPTPTLLHATTAGDSTRKLFELWAEVTGAELLLLERTIESRVELPQRWWSELPHGWGDALEGERLDQLEAELRATVARLERLTGRSFSPRRFQAVMDLVNEQEEWYRRTRDLIAATTPAPVGIADTMPATMVPQWHRGTAWGRDAAKALHDEVLARVHAGAAAHAGEQLRLMWVGRGLWRDMGFYQRFEQSHGAVFVWSMYLGLAADGYLRYTAPGQDPMRALAARFLTIGDELRMPTWAAAWHVHEAQTHGVHGALAIDDADPLVLHALEAAGVPVLRLEVDNTVGDAGALDAAVTAFLDRLA